MDGPAATRMILASKSPRRRDLLTQVGYAFEIVCPDVDESAIPSAGLTPARYAEILALAKARSVASRFPDRLVLGADTIVHSHGQIIGKAADAADAERITRQLFGAPHEVITGLALVRIEEGIELVRSDVTTVYPRQLTEAQIADHVVGGLWKGKAGAYGIQEKGDEFVQRIDGSLTNVMGLPMELLADLLKDVPL